MPPPPAASRSICSRCTTRYQSHRAFSSTPARSAAGPESPRFINVPEALQSPKPPKAPIKGLLPIPRNLFKTGKEDKSTDEYLERVMPRSKQDVRLKELPASERLAWKLRMTEARRANLKEGIRELMERKESYTRKSEVFSAARRDRHERLANRPEREDERLTAISLHTSVRQILAGGPKRQRNSGTRNKFLKREAQKSAQRKDQLHTLYTHARNFIVTEDAMNEALEKAFGTDERPIFWNRTGNSIWSTGADPADTKDMLDKDKSLATRFRKDFPDMETVAQKRMRKIAEEFTGGRIG